MRPRLLLLALALACAAPACKPRSTAEAGLVFPDVAVPAEIASLDQFAALRNLYAILPADHPERPRLRASLVDFLAGYLARELEQGRADEAANALDFLGGLFTPSELRSQSHGPQPAIAKAARSLYRAAARRGDEPPAMFALALEQHFGGANERKRALREWRDLEDWIVRNGMFSIEPILRHEELEETLEEAAARFPSPFVVQRLADLYVARYQAAVAASERGAEVGLAARQRAEVTGYLILRLYLRADDFEGAIAALKRIEVDLPTRKMIEFVERAQHGDKSAEPLLTLASQFVPEIASEDRGRIPPSFITQGWGIVENMARRAVQRFPEDPFAHVLMARALRQGGLLDAAIFHYDAALQRKGDIFDAWQELAELHQRTLDRLADSSVDEALERLAVIEKLHARAAAIWRDRPIEPGLPVAYVTAGQALYNAGRIDEAKALLERSLTVEPVAEALDLLGTIESKAGGDAAAALRYQAILDLPFPNQLARLRWETAARAGLGRLARRRGDAKAADEFQRAALRQLNTLIAFPSLPDDERSRLLVERGKVLFDLGDASLGLDDFRQARLSAPDRAQAYTDPMLFVISRGYYDEARDIFRQVLLRDDIRDTLKLYFSLWITELALGQGREADADALALIRGYANEPWPRKLALHAQGKLSYDDLLKGARDRGERAEAHFYEGLRRWRGGDPKGGKELMKKVLESEMMGFFEYDLAQHFLERGDLPRAPARR